VSHRIHLNWFNSELAERAAAIARGTAEPAPARDAATVVILRAPRSTGPGAGAPPSGHGTEILLLKRPATMNFAAGAYVFPGGRVDAADADPRIGWHGPSPAEFGARLGASADEARSLVVAAVRETYEESGVLLAGTPDGATVLPAGPDWAADRLALNAGQLSFAELLVRRGLVILADRLIPWARWVTPAAEPRRYDTRFFAAMVPPGQTADGHLAEADKIAWVTPDAALDAARAGEFTLLPPTAITLGEFAAAGDDLAAFLRQPREITPLQPHIVASDGEAWLEIPGKAPYPLLSPEDGARHDAADTGHIHRRLGV
jgi:8-oxo-dGTP pyrophosphatase MutT (NUDIX family)